MIGTKRSTEVLRARLGLEPSATLTGVSQLRLVAPRRSAEYFEPIVQVPPQIVEGREATLYVVGAGRDGGFRDLTPIRPVRPRRDGDEVLDLRGGTTG